MASFLRPPFSFLESSHSLSLSLSLFLCLCVSSDEERSGFGQISYFHKLDFHSQENPEVQIIQKFDPIDKVDNFGSLLLTWCNLDSKLAF